MLNKLSIIPFLVILLGCKKESIKILNLYENGNIERSYFINQDSIKHGELFEYFPNGRTSFKTKYTNGKLRDTLYYFRNDTKNDIEIKKIYVKNQQLYYEDFYRNGLTKQKGLQSKNEQRIGIWKNYDKKGNLHFVKEYKIIKGIEHTNQMWVMLPSGDTLTTGVSIKYRFDKDQLRLSDSIFCFFQLDDSAFKHTDTTTVAVVLPKDYTRANFNPDFSNYHEGDEHKKGIPITITPSLDRQKQTTNPLSLDAPNTVSFYWKPKRIGKDTIRGFFKETHTFLDPNLPENSTSDRILTQLDKKIYFEHPIEVVPELGQNHTFKFNILSK